MIETLSDVRLNDNEWYSLNTLLSQPVGSYIRLRNKSRHACLVFKGVQPVADSTVGTILAETRNEGLYLEIPSGSEEVWVRGNGAILSAEIGADPNPDGLFYGLRAESVQGYVEANVKHGRQFNIVFEVTVPTGSVTYAAFTTNTVASGFDTVIKSRIISTDGGMRYTPRVGATGIVAGTPVPIINLNARSATVSQNSAYLVTAVSSEGVPFDIVRSASGVGSNREQGIFQSPGIERILDRNSTYLIKFENLDNKDIYIVYTITFYEGILDIYPDEPI